MLELGIKDIRVTLDGQPAFLLGISYYGALGAPEALIEQDLQDMRRYGFNWLRVWANWAAFDNDVSAVDNMGYPHEPYLAKLQWLVAECDRHNLVVDVTLSRGNGVTGPPRLQTLEAHRRAVHTLVAALRSYHNWYLDLSNERNLEDARFASFDDLQHLRQVAKEADPQHLVTASHAGDMQLDELQAYLLQVGVDFVSVHRPRNAQSAAQTEDKTREYLQWMRDSGRVVPLHYQEPFRRGFGTWQPASDDFMADLQGARAAGAAGWCFHNGHQAEQEDGQPARSFDLRHRRLFEQLDAVEQDVLDRLRTAFIDHGIRT